MKKSIDLETFLRSFDSSFLNPFFNKNFYIRSIESLSEGNTIHKIKNIKMIFKNNSIIFKFKKEDFIWVLYIIVKSKNDSWGYDPNSKIVFKNDVLDYNTFDDQVLFKLLYDLIKLNLDDKNEITLKFNNQEDDWIFKFHKQVIYFYYDETCDDFKHFNEELNRWSLDDTDEEI